MATNVLHETQQLPFKDSGVPAERQLSVLQVHTAQGAGIQAVLSPPPRLHLPLAPLNDTATRLPADFHLGLTLPQILPDFVGESGTRRPVLLQTLEARPCPAPQVPHHLTMKFHILVFLRAAVGRTVTIKRCPVVSIT